MIKGMASTNATNKLSLKGAINVAVTSVAIMDDVIGSCRVNGSDNHWYVVLRKGNKQKNKEGSSNKRRNHPAGTSEAEKSNQDEEVIQLLKANSRSKGSRALCSKNIQNRVKQFHLRREKLVEQE